MNNKHLGNQIQEYNNLILTNKIKLMKAICKPPKLGGKFTLCGVRSFDLIFIEELSQHFKCFNNMDERTSGVCVRYAYEIVRRLDCFYY